MLAPGTPFELDTNLHSHNAYLQIWFEAGALGAALLLGLGLAVIGSLARTPPGVQPLLFAAFAAHALSAAFGYSIWAPWLLSSFALAAIFALPSLTLARRD